MTDRYDLVIMGMGSAGMVAADRRLDRATGGRGRTRPGRRHLPLDRMVPSKTLIASARAAHVMRTADRFGLRPVEPVVELSEVWRRIEPCRRRSRRLTTIRPAWPRWGSRSSAARPP